MGDRELEKDLRALGAELADKPNRAYRTWTLRTDVGEGSGYTGELIARKGGNLRTRTIDRGQF